MWKYRVAYGDFSVLIFMSPGMVFARSANCKYQPFHDYDYNNQLKYDLNRLYYKTDVTIKTSYYNNPIIHS